MILTGPLVLLVRSVLCPQSYSLTISSMSARRYLLIQSTLTSCKKTFLRHYHCVERSKDLSTQNSKHTAADIFYVFAQPWIGIQIALQALPTLLARYGVFSCGLHYASRHTVRCTSHHKSHFIAVLAAGTTRLRQLVNVWGDHPTLNPPGQRRHCVVILLAISTIRSQLCTPKGYSKLTAEELLISRFVSGGAVAGKH